MEALVIALAVIGRVYKQQEAIVPEPEFQPFNLQELTPLHTPEDKAPGRRSDRAASFVPQAAS